MVGSGVVWPLRPGKAWRGMAWLGVAVKAWLGRSGLGRPRRGGAGPHSLEQKGDSMVFQQEQKVLYGWREGFPHHGVSAQAVGEALAAIHAQYGDITPERICEAARRPGSPLRPFIEQDRKKAATAFQHQQAMEVRGAVRVCWVTYTGEAPSTTIVQAFVRHPLQARTALNTKGNVFVPVVEVLSQPAARAAHLREALHELASWRRRYRTFQELGRVFAALDSALPALEQDIEALDADEG